MCNGIASRQDFDTFNRNKVLLEKEYAFVIDDKGKTKRKSKMMAEEIEFLKWNKQLLEKLSGFVAVYEVYKKSISDECKNIMWEVLSYALAAHKSLVVQEENAFVKTEKIHIAELNVNNHNELFF